MLKIKIDCWKIQTLIEKSPEIYRALQVASEKTESKLIPYENLEKNEKGEIKQTYRGFECFINSIDDLPNEILKISEFEKPEVLNLVSPDGQSISGMNLERAMQCHQVYLPDNALLKINEVKVLENICTDVLNNELQDGWRIVAVCPQPASRRPDYVLGRHFTKEVI